MLKACYFEDFTMSLQENVPCISMKIATLLNANTNICTFRRFFKSKDIPTILILKLQNLRERWADIGKRDTKEKLELRVSREQLRRISCVSVMRRMVDGSDTVLFGDRKNPLGWYWKYNWRASSDTQWTAKISRKAGHFERSPRFNLEDAEQEFARENHVVRDQGAYLADKLWR